MKVGKLKTLSINLALSVSSVALLLGAMELVARGIDPHVPFLLIPRDFNCLQRSPVYSIEFRPRCSGVLSDTNYATNSLGMRGSEVRDDGSRRILALGDSCTWGWRVPQNETYPAVLETRLGTRPGAAATQVMNAGVPGYTSHQGLVYLREKGLALEPAIVIVGFGWNDATPAGDLERQIAFERRFMPFIRFDDRLLIESKLYRWLRYRSFEKPVRREVRVPLARYAANLEATIDLAHGRGAHVVLLNFWQREARPRWYDTVVGVAERRGVPMIPYQGPRYDLVHPTVEGQALLAGEILDVIERRRFLEDDARPPVNRAEPR